MATIYHYTSLDVFSKMLDICLNTTPNALTFWASNAYAMNDYGEMQYGYPLLKSFLRAYEQAFPSEKRLSEVLDLEKDSEFFTQKEDFLVEDESPYVLSFSKEKDFIPMWSLYGDKCRGVCLGFDEDKILKEIHNGDTVFYNNAVYAPHDYEQDPGPDWNGFVSKLRNEVIRAHKILELAPCGDMGKKKFKQSFLRKLCTIVSAFIKSEKYRYEQESRILFLIGPKTEMIHFRTTPRTNMIPYIIREIPLTYLTSVIVGPDLYLSSVKDTLSVALRACGSQAEVISSEITYRNV